jgi:hypothetical protein
MSGIYFSSATSGKVKFLLVNLIGFPPEFFSEAASSGLSLFYITSSDTSFRENSSSSSSSSSVFSSIYAVLRFDDLDLDFFEITDRWEDPLAGIITGVITGVITGDILFGELSCYDST